MSLLGSELKTHLLPIADRNIRLGESRNKTETSRSFFPFPLIYGYANSFVACSFLMKLSLAYRIPTIYWSAMLPDTRPP